MEGEWEGDGEVDGQVEGGESQEKLHHILYFFSRFGFEQKYFNHNKKPLNYHIIIIIT